MFYNMLVEMAMNDFFVVLGSNKHLHPGGNPFSRMQRYGFRAPGSTFPYIVRSISLVFFDFFLRCGVYLSVICHFFQIFFPGFLLLNRFFLGFMIFFHFTRFAELFFEFSVDFLVIYRLLASFFSIFPTNSLIFFLHSLLFLPNLLKSSENPTIIFIHEFPFFTLSPYTLQISSFISIVDHSFSLWAILDEFTTVQLISMSCSNFQIIRISIH